MIRFSLSCDQDHAFDAWFSSSADFDSQRERGLVQCPYCNSGKVDKSLMAPSISKKKEAVSQAAGVPVSTEQAAMLNELRKIRDEIVSKSENVGANFSEEARKIHYGEADSRPIIGEANKEQAMSLLEEGIAVSPLPILPGDQN